MMAFPFFQGPVENLVNRQIQAARADESATMLQIGDLFAKTPHLLPVTDAGRIMAYLQESPRVHILEIYNFVLHNDAVLNVFRNNLPLCTSVKTINLYGTKLSNEDLERLRPVFYNTSVTTLSLGANVFPSTSTSLTNNIQGKHGGEALRDSLVGNSTLEAFDLNRNPIGPEGAIGLGQGMAGNECLQKLYLNGCNIGNDGLANLLLSMCGEMTNNNSTLLHLHLSHNNIKGEEGGRLVGLLLKRFPALKMLRLDYNMLGGPLFARALAPSLAAATQLEDLVLRGCGLGNDGVTCLIPDGQVNRSLTNLVLEDNDIQGLEGGENVIALVARCTNLDRLDVNDNVLSPDQQCRLDLLLDRKRLCTAAAALAGITFSVLFRAVEEAHGHEHGLSAIFVILQNDGEDYFYTAHHRHAN